MGISWHSVSSFREGGDEPSPAPRLRALVIGCELARLFLEEGTVCWAGLGWVQCEGVWKVP